MDNVWHLLEKGTQLQQQYMPIWASLVITLASLLAFFILVLVTYRKVMRTGTIEGKDVTSFLWKTAFYMLVGYASWNMVAGFFMFLLALLTALIVTFYFDIFKGGFKQWRPWVVGIPLAIIVLGMPFHALGAWTWWPTVIALPILVIAAFVTWRPVWIFQLVTMGIFAVVFTFVTNGLIDTIALMIPWARIFFAF